MFSLLPKTMPPGLPLYVSIYQFALLYVASIGLYLKSLIPAPADFISITKPEVPAELINKALISNFCYISAAEKRFGDNKFPAIVSNTMRR
jgi:hypothetical protein